MSTKQAIDYKQLARVDVLPGLGALALADKARAIQALLEENFFHPSGLFYSLLLITGAREVRPMARADLIGASVHAAEMFHDGGETQEAAAGEGMTFENSIFSAGLYLQAQAARYAATADPAAYTQALRAFAALDQVYEYSRQRGHAGWLGKPYGLVPKDHSTPDQYHTAILGLYRFHEVARPAERARIATMLRDIADFLTARNYQIWDLRKPVEPDSWQVTFDYCNITYVLSQAVAFRLTGEARYRDEALRLASRSRWRERSHLDEWAEQGLTRFLEFERVCLGSFIIQAAGPLHELLPELFGATPEAARSGLEHVLERWWEYSRLGIDDEGFQHYWIDVDVADRTWRPTGIRPNQRPPVPGSFFTAYSDVRWSDSLYRAVNAACVVIQHLPSRREATLAWLREIMRRTDGQRLRWMIDRDGQQLKPDVAWMGCMLSSEAPFQFLIAYWRGLAQQHWC